MSYPTCCISTALCCIITAGTGNAAPILQPTLKPSMSNLLLPHDSAKPKPSPQLTVISWIQPCKPSVIPSPPALIIPFNIVLGILFKNFLNSFLYNEAIIAPPGLRKPNNSAVTPNFSKPAWAAAPANDFKIISSVFSSVNISINSSAVGVLPPFWAIIDCLKVSMVLEVNSLAVIFKVPKNDIALPTPCMVYPIGFPTPGSFLTALPDISKIPPTYIGSIVSAWPTKCLIKVVTSLNSVLGSNANPAFTSAVIISVVFLNNSAVAFRSVSKILSTFSFLFPWSSTPSTICLIVKSPYFQPVPPYTLAHGVWLIQLPDSPPTAHLSKYLTNLCTPENSFLSTGEK